MATTSALTQRWDMPVPASRAGRLAAGKPHSADQALPVQWIVVAVLVGVVLFNPALAIVNAHVTALTGNIVALAQAALVFAALALVLLRPMSADRRWLAFIWLSALLFVLLSLFRGALVPKNYGDLLMFPAFVLLGMRMEPRWAIRLLLGIQLLLVVAGLWEMLAVQSYGHVLGVSQYYINTRGFSETSFWAGNSDLFVSSQRPSGRILFPQTGWHRGSSLFLEPVSLGNWCVVSALMTIVFWRRVTWAPRLFLIASTIFLLVVCDGRFALMVSVLFAVALPFAQRLPRWLPATYLPAVILALLAAMPLGLQNHIGDDFLGRLSFGAGVIQRLGAVDLLGVGGIRSGAADSGIAYFILTQSLLGMLALWFLLMLTDLGAGPEAARLKHGAGLFISLCAPVSYSIFSIKTGAYLWAVFGMFYAMRASETTPDAAPADTAPPPLFWAPAPRRVR